MPKDNVTTNNLSSEQGTSVQKKTPPKAHKRTSQPTRRTVEAIDRLTDDELNAQIDYRHDSNFTAPGRSSQGRKRYSRARKDLDAVQQNANYTRYLSVPKGNQTIFTRGRQRRFIMIIAGVLVIICVLLLLAHLLWELIV